jgi:benzoate-CoA ligase family protein
VTAGFADRAAPCAASPHLRDVVVAGAPADLVGEVAAGIEGAAGPGRVRVRDHAAFLAAASASGAGTAAEQPAAPTLADSPGFWLYTSGTTGTPKGAMHRHAALRATAGTYARDVLGIRPDDVCYSVPKLFFAYGLGNSLTFPLSVGAATILDPAPPSPARVAATLAAYRPTLFFGVPTFYAALLAADLPADTFAGVRACVSAGEPLPAALYRRFTERFGVEVLDGIGSTEALHIFLSNRPGRVRPGTTGEPVAGYRLRLEDDAGAPVTDGEPGNLYVSGDSIATGYWCRTAVTRRVFRGEWLRTGDTYVRDADGYYTCLGRADEILKAGGIWVAPAEVEARLMEHPDVAAAAVVSVPDDDGLDKPVACVVPVGGRGVDEAELIAFCRAGLASYKRPRRVLAVDELPLTATGKLQRFKVRAYALGLLHPAGSTGVDAAGTTPPAARSTPDAGSTPTAAGTAPDAGTAPAGAPVAAGAPAGGPAADGGA